MHEESWQPIAYGLRRLSDAETRYAQIEKECLAGACERFQKYLVGMDNFRLITDHKPLVPLINSKDLDAVPVRCQRLLMRLMGFNGKAEYAPGKTLFIADTLSHSPIDEVESTTESIIASHVNAVVHIWPVSQRKLDMIRSATEENEQLQRMRKLIREGWPERVSSVADNIRDYDTLKDSLSRVRRPHHIRLPHCDTQIHEAGDVGPHTSCSSKPVEMQRTCAGDSVVAWNISRY